MTARMIPSDILLEWCKERVGHASCVTVDLVACLLDALLKDMGLTEEAEALYKHYCEMWGGE